MPQPTNPRTLKDIGLPWENKREKYLALHLTQWCHFTPFIVSVNGLWAMMLMLWFARFASKYASKLRKTYAVVCGLYVQLHQHFVIHWATHHCHWDYHLPVGCLSSACPHWLDGADPVCTLSNHHPLFLLPPFPTFAPLSTSLHFLPSYCLTSISFMIHLSFPLLLVWLAWAYSRLLLAFSTSQLSMPKFI